MAENNKGGAKKVTFTRPRIPHASATVRDDGLMTSKPGDVLIELDLSLIDFDEEQHRQSMDSAGVVEIGDSIEQVGVLQAIIVMPANKEGRYKLVLGERRARGSILKKKKTIPALVRQYTDLEADIAQVVENTQRENVSPMQTARKLRRMMVAHNLKAVEIALKIGKKEAYISQHLRLLDMEPSIADLAEKAILRDVDTLTNIDKLFAIKPEAAMALVKKAQSGKKITREESSTALRQAKEEAKPAKKSSSAVEAAAKAKLAGAQLGLEIQVVADQHCDPVIYEKFVSAAGNGRALIDFTQVVNGKPGRFASVTVIFEKTGATLENVPLKDLRLLEITKLHMVKA